MIRFLCFTLLIIICKSEEEIQSREVNRDCGHGHIYSINENQTYCKCDRGWINNERGNQTICDYEQKSQLAAFLLSFFLGISGADWYYLSASNGGYIAAGIFKMLTLGGLGIWWLVDWIRVLTNAFTDGQGQPLLPWNP